MNILSKFFKKKKPKKEQHMDIFSKEALDALTAQHKFVSATILQIQTNMKNFASRHGVDPTSTALSMLKAEKIILEGKIDVLTEYLN